MIKSHRHWKLKEKAIRLRKQGLSYNEIIQKVPVTKSTISLWVRDVQLTSKQVKRLTAKHDFRLKGIKAIQNMFWERRKEAFSRGVLSIKKVSKEGRFLAGLGLYWAEGNKKKGSVITNSDPKIIVFMVRWFKEFYKISPELMSVELHLHTGQNEINMRKYWSRLTQIPLVNFTKSFVKVEGSGYRKNVHYMGTVKIRIQGKGSTYLLFQILGSISALINHNLGWKTKPEDWMDKLPYAK